VLGFGGIGAILRYKLNFEQLAEDDDDDEFYDGTLYWCSLTWQTHKHNEISFKMLTLAFRLTI
jgi:hypothetical protein